VVNDSRVNAYALPGGKISITRGMLAKMENEAQLAAVLGHEIGHVAARHSAKGYTRNVLAGILSNIAAVALESSSVTGSDLILQSGQVLSNMVLMKYSRNQERQADQLGMEYMVRAGYNPQGMIGVTEILQSLSERRPSLVEVMFSSHPPSQERYQAALQQAQTYPDSSIGSDTLYIQPFQRATTSIRRTQPAYAKMDEALKIAKSDGDYEKARDIIVGASAEAPNQALIWMMRAEFERKTKQRQQAYRSAKHSVRLYPGLFYGQYLAGITAFEVREYRQSLDHLERADSIFSGVSEIVYYKGRNYEVLGFRDRAAQAYYQFLQKVRKGEMAQYCYKRLRQWGYL
jgi:predicted Zn-dependent protease